MHFFIKKYFNKNEINGITYCKKKIGYYPVLRVFSVYNVETKCGWW